MVPFSVILKAKRRDVIGLTVVHLWLVLSSLMGGWSYAAMQVFLIVQLLIATIITGFFYPERGVLDRLLAILMTIVAFTFLGSLSVIAYGAAASGGGDWAEPVLARNAHIDFKALGFAIAYVVTALLMTLMSALRSDDPKLAWTQSEMGSCYSTAIVMGFMIFFGIFVAAPLIRLMLYFGIHVDTDVFLTCVMVALRFLMALVISTLNRNQWAAMAQRTDVTDLSQAS